MKLALAFAILAAAFGTAPAQEAGAPRSPAHVWAREFCVNCHSPDKTSGDFDLESLLDDDLSSYPEAWEKVFRRLRTRQMPPPERKRPDEAAYRQMVAWLGDALDRAAPEPGRTDTFRRLNRTEYQNAIRDLLAIEIDASALLPKDEASHGFDNITVGTLSPMLLDRYITAAQKISRLAIGASATAPGGETYRVKADITQEDHVEGLPIGTRGGALFAHTFPLDAEYEIHVRLARDRNEEIEGLHEPHQLEIFIDDQPVQSFTVAPPKGHRDFELVDGHLKFRLPVQAGPRKVGVTFAKNGSSLAETKRQPYSSRYNVHRHPRLNPAIYQVSINGPYNAKGPGETPSRQRIFTRMPANADESEPCAEEILSKLMRRAFRRPPSEEDRARAMRFFRAGQDEGGFEMGIESALSSILVSPNFLFRIERDPAEERGVYPLGDLELASRLSFFLWSSIPDDELLDLAERGELAQPEVLERQARRMLAHPRAAELASNFAGQWLHLRNLDSITPDLRLFPDFDDNLRQSFRRETELVFEEIVREDRGAVELLNAGWTYLNERLARHYGLPHIQGNRFRRVNLSSDSRRGGLLRHGSVLTVTSYATRTSPVIRGHWILGNILGTPTPPPPANVPNLKDNTVNSKLSVRERLAEHRANPACASCHDLMDPVGFALENFDALGRWRELEEGLPVDATGGLPDGGKFEGIAGLEQALLQRPEMFVSTLTEKLLTFALGRGVEYYDAPAVRKIVRDAAKDEYRFSSLIVGIVTSTPFTLRRTL